MSYGRVLAFGLAKKDFTSAGNFLIRRRAPMASRFISSLVCTTRLETLRFTRAQTCSSGFRCGEYGGR
ncbi:hypothetical protein WM24_18805 [Burkholderia ubonensis]|nr:hypothetical protein WM24_18805 [Burkholderia ubonensis]